MLFSWLSNSIYSIYSVFAFQRESGPSEPILHPKGAHLEGQTQLLLVEWANYVGLHMWASMQNQPSVVQISQSGKVVDVKGLPIAHWDAWRGPTV